MDAINYQTVKDRLKAFIKYKGLGQGRFEVTCGLSNGYVNNIRQSIQPDKLQKIALCFPDLNTGWLMTGKGEMLNASTVEPVKNYTVGVPYYNVDFLGGFDLVYNDRSINPEYLIDFAPYNKATCWCNITGHSMEPEISSGDIIALKEINDPSFLPFGEIYAIVAINGQRTVKRIGPASTPDCYALIPSNKSPEYGVQEIPKNYIYKIYQVLGCVKKF